MSVSEDGYRDLIPVRSTIEDDYDYDDYCDDDCACNTTEPKIEATVSDPCGTGTSDILKYTQYQETTRKLLERMKQKIKEAEDKCSHLQGGNQLSDEQGDKTAIVWHLFDDGVVRGQCLVCQKKFIPFADKDVADPEFVGWFRKQSGCSISSGAIPTTDFLDVFNEIKIVRDSVRQERSAGFRDGYSQASYCGGLNTQQERERADKLALKYDKARNLAMAGIGAAVMFALALAAALIK